MPNDTDENAQAEQPADEQPADEQPADEQPADEQPADEQPADENAQAEQPADEQPVDEAAYHVVCPGESWASIAERYGTSVEALHALNAHAPHFSDRSVTVNHAVRVR